MGGEGLLVLHKVGNATTGISTCSFIVDRAYLLIRLSFIRGTAAIVIGNQQEFLRGCRVDVVPLLNGIAKRRFRFEG